MLKLCVAILILVIGAPGRAQQAPSTHVHAFFYLWYSNASRSYLHWDHELLPHWSEHTRNSFPHGGGYYSPPARIAARYYPCRGCYDSQDPAVLLGQMQELRRAGVGVVALSWWARGSGGDSQHIETDDAVPAVLRAAEEVGIKVSHGCACELSAKVAFHLEPFPGMGIASVRANIEYILAAYGASSALYRDETGRPWFYAYDAYHIATHEWARLLTPSGDATIRGTPLDACMISLYVNDGDVATIAAGGFDGLYTYFASTTFSHGADTRHWPQLARLASEKGLIFVPCVSPGYDDRAIRPWNGGVREERRGTQRYDETWQAALACGARHVAITSFNEWGEGTQIECALTAPAVAAILADAPPAPAGVQRDYETYSAESIFAERTLHWVNKLATTATVLDEL